MSRTVEIYCHQELPLGMSELAFRTPKQITLGGMIREDLQVLGMIPKAIKDGGIILDRRLVIVIGLGLSAWIVGAQHTGVVHAAGMHGGLTQSGNFIGCVEQTAHFIMEAPNTPCGPDGKIPDGSVVLIGDTDRSGNFLPMPYNMMDGVIGPGFSNTKYATIEDVKTFEFEKKGDVLIGLDKNRVKQGWQIPIEEKAVDQGLNIDLSKVDKTVTDAAKVVVDNASAATNQAKTVAEEGINNANAGIEAKIPLDNSAHNNFKDVIGPAIVGSIFLAICFQKAAKRGLYWMRELYKDAVRRKNYTDLGVVDKTGDFVRDPKVEAERKAEKERIENRDDWRYKYPNVYNPYDESKK